MQPKEIEKKILEICEAEGILKEKMGATSKFHFAFKIIFPPWHSQPKNLVILMPLNKQYVSIELATKISPEHIELFKKLEKEQGVDLIPLFFHLLRNMLLSKNLFFNFNEKNHTYIMNEHVYFDGLTLDNFYRRIRKLYYASLTAQLTLNEILSGKFKGFRLPPVKTDSSEADGGSPEDLFYS